MTCDDQRIQSGRASRATGLGFTLVELLLTLALILLLAAAAAFNFASLQRGKHLDEGMLQFEALLRFARSQAESSGRPIQLIFEDPATSGAGTDPGPGTATSAGSSTNRVLKLRWEPDPLGAPGIYSNLPQTPHYLEAIQEHLIIEEVQRFDGAIPQLTSVGDPNASNVPIRSSPQAQPVDASGKPTDGSNGFNGDDLSMELRESPIITFYPDGSSDSARFIVSSQDSEDLRRMALELTGVTGAIHRHRAPRDGEPLDPVEETDEPETDLPEGDPTP